MRIKEYFKRAKDNVVLELAVRKGRKETLMVMNRQWRPLKEIVTRFPDITAEEIMQRAELYIDPLDKHHHEIASYFGGAERHDRLCMTVLRRWVEGLGETSPDIAERLSRELEGQREQMAVLS